MKLGQSERVELGMPCVTGWTARTASGSFLRPDGGMFFFFSFFFSFFFFAETHEARSREGA